MSERLYTRRDILKRAAAAAIIGGGAALALEREVPQLLHLLVPKEPTLPPYESKTTNFRFVEEVYSDQNPDQPGWHISDKPHPQEVPLYRGLVKDNDMKGHIDYYNDGKVIFRSSPLIPIEYREPFGGFDHESAYEGLENWNDGFLHKLLIDPSAINTKFVTPVLGVEVEDLSDITGEFSMYEDIYNASGEKLAGNIWYGLSDKDGNFVDPKGQFVKKGDAPFFISNLNFIEPIPTY